MEADELLLAVPKFAAGAEMAEAEEAEAELPSGRPVVTIISTRTGRRTSIHHDTDFADKMNAYIVSPLIPLPKPRLPHQLQPQQQQQPQQPRKQLRQKQPRTARRSVSCPEPATASSSSSAAAASSSQRQSPTPHQSFFQPHQRQHSGGQQRRKQTGRNPTLERLLQPSAREMSRSEQLLDKMRNLKLRIQRHAVQTNCGNVSVTDWPPPPDVLLAHAPLPIQRATPTSPPPAASSTSGSDGGGIVCSDSDIRSIIASIQQFEKSVQQSHMAQLIEVISLPLEPPLPPCLTSSPHRQQKQPVRKQVCFIDPKQNRLVMPHHLAPASSTVATASAQAVTAAAASEAPVASNSPGESPTATPQQRRSPPPPRQAPSPPLQPPSSPLPTPSPSGTSVGRCGSLCGACHRSFDHCAAGDVPGPSSSSRTPPPRDVCYDENGQTWDVYGADIDPDLLGQAIQTHLASRCNGTGEETSEVVTAAVPAPSSLNSPRRVQASAASLLCCAGGRA